MQQAFPYTLQSKNEIIASINALAAKSIPFIFIISYDTKSGYVIPQDALNEEFIRFDLTGKSSSFKLNKSLQWDSNPINFDVYQQKIDFVKSQIHLGNSFLVNLTQPTKISTNLSLSEIYDVSAARYKLWLRNQFVVLSPESFVTIKQGRISSFPMKGTIDAALPKAAETILNDAKEKAEHATIVDLIRNDLSMVAENVWVERYRYIDTLQTNKGELLQVSSEICGDLPSNYKNNLAEIIMKLLPAGSICGAPKAKTLEIIEQAEGYDRGFYTGVFGYFDGENLDSAVMIRFIEQQKDGLVFKSGGGITSQSNNQSEYYELIRKIYVPFY